MPDESSGAPVDLSVANALTPEHTAAREHNLRAKAHPLSQPGAAEDAVAATIYMFADRGHRVWSGQARPHILGGSRRSWPFLTR